MTTQEQEALLPCPFCGHAEPYVADSQYQDVWVKCDDCGASGPHVDKRGLRSPSAAWNRRATIAAPQAETPKTLDAGQVSALVAHVKAMRAAMKRLDAYYKSTMTIDGKVYALIELEALEEARWVKSADGLARIFLDAAADAAGFTSAAPRAEVGRCKAHIWDAESERDEAIKLCMEKLRLYRKGHSGEYVGGMEFTELMRVCEAAIQPQRHHAAPVDAGLVARADEMLAVGAAKFPNASMYQIVRDLRDALVSNRIITKE